MSTGRLHEGDMAMTATEKPKSLREHLKERWEHAGHFSPGKALYFPDGDHMTVYFSAAMCREKRVDDLLTVYLSEQDGELVGCKITGVSRLVKNITSLVDISHEDVQVQWLIVSINGPNPPAEYVYKLSQRMKGVTFRPADIQRAIKAGSKLDRGTSAACLLNL
jgi:hypothetical protein